MTIEFKLYSHNFTKRQERYLSEKSFEVLWSALSIPRIGDFIDPTILNQQLPQDVFANKFKDANWSVSGVIWSKSADDKVIAVIWLTQSS